MLDTKKSQIIVSVISGVVILCASVGIIEKQSRGLKKIEAQQKEISINQSIVINKVFWSVK
jgi:hypothetical protein